MALALLTSAASAADNKPLSAIKVRGSDKENYSRIVFDGANASKKLPKFTAQKTANKLVITFADEVNLKADGAPLQNLARVTDYKILSPQQVEIDFADGQDVRHFVADTRLVIDIKGDVKKDSKKPAAPVNLAPKIEAATPKAEAPKKEDTVPAEAAVKEALASQKNIVVDEAPSEATKSEPEKPNKTYHISLTSTSAVPLTVFERNGYLWMVQGKENIKLPPQILSEKGEAFGQFEPIPSSGGVSIFRIKMPKGLNKSVKGGGLVWKFDITDKPVNAEKPLPFKRVFEENGKATDPFLIWPAAVLNRVTEIQDPESGDTITIALVEIAKDVAGAAQSFVDFDVLPSLVGLAVIPKSDDLKIAKSEEGVLFSKPGGLKIAPERDILTANEVKKADHSAAGTPKDAAHIYDFKNWQIGTKQELSANQRLLMSVMSNQTEAKKAEGLIGLARLALSFNYAPEAMGYLELAKDMVPEIDSNPEFMALMGAAQTLSWKPKEAYQIFSNASLNDVADIPYWKSYTLAKLDDWQQAGKVLPNDTSIFENYSDDIKTPLVLTLVEVALRDGDIAKAKSFMDVVEPLREGMSLPYASAYDYLLGEFNRQSKKPKEAKEIWKELSEGLDDLYRAKARFALTMMQLDAKEITEDKAVDNLEGLRYAWRGDDLEVSINNNLAKIYLKKNEPIKALTLMDLAKTLNPSSDQGKKIDGDMREAFKGLFAPDKIKTLSPVDVLILYNDFASLMPPGADGQEITRQLAERMANADLLPRATALLKKQLDGGLQGGEGSTVALRLATLQIMDSKPDDALVSLDKAETLLKGLSAEEVLPKQVDIGLLRAKAYSLKGKPDEAFASLALLPQDENSLKLRADIAWRAKKWQDAADALELLVQNQDISLTRPLTDEQADLLLNWAVALYLADNRYVLANLRERYSDAMAATTKAQKFDVVTRPRQASLLADKETINSIIDETTIFKDFLNSFKSSDVPSKPIIGGAPIGKTPADIPEQLKNAQGLKTDEVLGD